MLETYFIRPDTIDRLRASWIAGAIERMSIGSRTSGMRDHHSEPLRRKMADETRNAIEQMLRLHEVWFDEAPPDPYATPTTP